jgi:hypothetical protein
MSVIAGKEAYVIYNDENGDSRVLHGVSWTMTAEAGEGETTEMTPGGATDKTFIPLINEFSGSITCRLGSGSLAATLDGATTEVCLYIKYIPGLSAFGYRGSAICTGVSPTVDVNGVPEDVVTFRGTDALALGIIEGPLTVSGTGTAADSAYTFEGYTGDGSTAEFAHLTDPDWTLSYSTVNEAYTLYYEGANDSINTTPINGQYDPRGEYTGDGVIIVGTFTVDF